MEFHSPPHPSTALSSSTDHKVDLLQDFPPSLTRDPLDPVYMGRMRCKQDLQKLYEDISERFYDLSFKDIVDPCYSISGNLKAMVAEAEAEDTRKSHSKKCASIPKLTFGFFFLGLRGKSKGAARLDLCASKTSTPLSDDGEDGEIPQLDPVMKLSPARSSSETRFSSSMSRIHPSNQCSTCSTYTIFFKCRCLTCGKLYCSNCSKEHINIRADGYQCKESCKNRLLSKRISQRIGSACLPFGNSF